MTKIACTVACSLIVGSSAAVAHADAPAASNTIASSTATVRTVELTSESRPGDWSLYTAGNIVLGMGIAFGVASIATFSVGAATHPSDATRRREMTAGGVLGGVFLLHLPVGLPMVLHASPRTRLQDVESRKTSRARKPRYWAGEF